MARNPLASPRISNAFRAPTARQANLSAGNKVAFLTLNQLSRELTKRAAVVLKAEIESTISAVEAQSKSLKPKNVFVSGTRNPSVASVLGMRKATTIDFDHRPEAATHALQVLAKGRGIPVDEGDYSESFRVFVNGAESTPAGIGFFSTVEIVNVQPYSRMLEVGYGNDGKPFVKQVDQHIIERIMAWQMKLKWVHGRINAAFVYTTIPNPYILKTDFHTGRLGRRGKPKADRVAGQPINYPAVKLSI